MANGKTTGTTTSQRITIYVRGQIGKQIGKGECYDLADRALRQAGAKSASAYGEITDDADYVWGTLVDLKDVLPGDVLQFRDHEIKTTTTTTTRTTLLDGSWKKETTTQEHTQSRGHHTAVVGANPGNGVLEIFEQHVKPLGKKVQYHTLHITDSTTGPVTKITRGKGGARVEVTTETTIEVSGRIWAYRPQPN